MRRRRSVSGDIFDQLFEALFELTGLFWQVGAFVTALLVILALAALRWVIAQKTELAVSPLLGRLAESYGWLLYLLPLMLLLVAWLFGRKTYQAYREQKFH
jgi:hypothetical protein